MSDTAVEPIDCMMADCCRETVGAVTDSWLMVTASAAGMQMVRTLEEPLEEWGQLPGHMKQDKEL
jgi:hypothetical protein